MAISEQPPASPHQNDQPTSANDDDGRAYDIEPIPLGAMQDSDWIPIAELAILLRGFGPKNGCVSKISPSPTNDDVDTIADHQGCAKYSAIDHFPRSVYGTPDFRINLRYYSTDCRNDERVYERRYIANDSDRCPPPRKRLKNNNGVPIESCLYGSNTIGQCDQYSSRSGQDQRPISPSSKFSANPILWEERMSELRDFRELNGHCVVPHNYKESQPLAQWVRRQRCQYKFRLEGKKSTLTDERIQQLNEIGFVWDSRSVKWEERYGELATFKSINGHCNIPITSTDQHKLAIWVKCQRRQYMLQQRGQTTAMTEDRIARLERIGFVWYPRRQL